MQALSNATVNFVLSGTNPFSVIDFGEVSIENIRELGGADSASRLARDVVHKSRNLPIFCIEK